MGQLPSNPDHWYTNEVEYIAGFGLGQIAGLNVPEGGDFSGGRHRDQPAHH
jgi:hypothetical protein